MQQQTALAIRSIMAANEKRRLKRKQKPQRYRQRVCWGAEMKHYRRVERWLAGVASKTLKKLHICDFSDLLNSPLIAQTKPKAKEVKTTLSLNSI
jgi:hypothetical protein